MEVGLKRRGGDKVRGERGGQYGGVLRELRELRVRGGGVWWWWCVVVVAVGGGGGDGGGGGGGRWGWKRREAGG